MVDNLIKKILRESVLVTEGPLCGDKTGDACGNCGDGYVWTDSYVTNSCICNHSNGAVCHSTGSYVNNDDSIQIDDLYIPTTSTGIKNVGRGDKATDSLRHSHLREDYFPRGEFNVTGTYKGVKPYYNFQSQGPTPGTFKGPGYNYESKGPEGVNYFMEEDGDEINPWAVCTTSLGLEGKKRKNYTQKEKDKYEKCVLSMKGKIKESHIDRIVKKTLNESWMAFLHQNHVEAACEECEANGCECSASRYKRDRWGAWTLQVNCYGRTGQCGYYDNISTGSPTDDTELKSRNIDITGDRLTKTTINENKINHLVNKILKEEENECTNCYCDHSNCSVGDSCLANLGGNLYAGTMTNCAAGQPGCAQGANNAWVMCVAYGVNPGNTSTGNIAMLSDKGSGFVNKQGGSDRLSKFNRRQIGESKHGGSYMAKKQLWSIADKAKDMAERLPDNTQLEDWMESHIAKADSMMDSVYDSFDYDNQMEIPGFEGTMDALNDLSIYETK